MWKNQAGFIVGTYTWCQLYKEYELRLCACSLFYRKTGDITTILQQEEASKCIDNILSKMFQVSVSRSVWGAVIPSALLKG